MKWVLLIAAALTLLLPTDLVPDFVPVLGWLDDLLGALVLVYQLIDAIRERRTKVLPTRHKFPKGR